jgi:glycosyltransferase involved in cell wall biosynthesis
MLVDVHDVFGLAEAIKALVEDPETRSQLATAARSRVQERFASRSAHRAIHALYLRTLDHST